MEVTVNNVSNERRFQVHLGLLPLLGGLLAGLGLLVVLQQAGTLYPTVVVTVVFLVGGALLGIVLPTLLHAVRPHRTG